MPVMDYINELKNQRDMLADILSEKGITASQTEKFNTLIPKVRDISGGNNEFDISGIFGLFTADSIDISNNLWKNEISGYNDIALTGGSKNGDAIHFAAGEYGLFTCIEPNTVYVVFKSTYSTKDASYEYYPIITKALTSNSKYAFDIFKLYMQSQLYNFPIFSSLYSSDVEILSTNTADYHVYCYSRNGTIAKCYVDGIYKGELTTQTGRYNGYMLLNNCQRGGSLTSATANGESEMKMCAFGLTYHDESIVQKNTAYLMQKYAINAGE